MGAVIRGRIWLWEVASGKIRAVLEGHQQRVTSIAWSGDGKWIASASAEKEVRLSDATLERKKRRSMATLAPCFR